MKTYKLIKLTIVFAIFMALFAVSCNKDDEPLSRTEMLARKWQLISIGEYSTSFYTGFDQVTYNFTTDGKMDLICTLNDISLSLVCDWKWTKNYLAIEITYEDEDIIMTLKKLTTKDFWYYSEGDPGTSKCTAVE